MGNKKARAVTEVEVASSPRALAVGDEFQSAMGVKSSEREVSLHDGSSLESHRVPWQGKELNRSLPHGRVVKFTPTGVENVYLLQAKIVRPSMVWLTLAMTPLCCLFVMMLIVQPLGLSPIFSLLALIPAAGTFLGQRYCAPTFTAKVRGVNMLPMADAMASSLREVLSEDSAKEDEDHIIYGHILERIQSNASKSIPGEFTLVGDTFSRRMAKEMKRGEGVGTEGLPSIPSSASFLALSAVPGKKVRGNAVASSTVSSTFTAKEVSSISGGINSPVDDSGEVRRRLQGVKRSNAPVKAKSLAGELLSLYSIQDELGSAQDAALRELGQEFLGIMESRERMLRGPYTATAEERAVLEECLDLLATPLERLRASYVRDRQASLESKRHYLSGKYPSAGDLS